MADDSTETTIERIHCNDCRQKTRHALLHQVVERDLEELEDGPTLRWTIESDTLQCCGRGHVTLRRSSFHDFAPAQVTIQYFPPPVSRHPPSWQFAETLPDEMRSVMGEVYQSLDANNHRLPMMGARTLIDMLMVDKVGDVGTFDAKLKKLEGLGVISSRNREVLAAALDVGSAAAHRGHAPKTDEVNAVMDIVENLLHAVYVLPKMAEDLKKTTPPPRVRSRLHRFSEDCLRGLALNQLRPACALRCCDSPAACG